ncbi:MAG: FtsW/RodA/SpoVE family cell cycle protein [Microgenomates group bacterium]
MKSRRFILIIFSLLLIGLVFISISSITEASHTLGDKFFFIKKQLVWSGIGIFSFIFASKIPLSLIKKYSPHFYIFTVILLLLTLIPQFSNSALGARRWLDLGGIGIQPSEIFKLSSIIFFAHIFSFEKYRQIKYIFYYLLLPLCLIMLEPNMSTTVLAGAIVITIFYVSGGSLSTIITLCALAIISSVILIAVSPYRKARLDSTSYHSNQMALTITSGHLLGKGFANSDQKYRYLPKISTDSILAVIGEETGFIGISLIIFLFYTLISNIFLLGLSQSPTSFNYLLCLGIGSWLAYQSLINMAAVASLIPLTGVTLPLISYGGSSLTTCLLGLGLINNLIYSSKNETSKNHHYHRHTSHSRH